MSLDKKGKNAKQSLNDLMNKGRREKNEKQEELNQQYQKFLKTDTTNVWFNNKEYTDFVNIKNRHEKNYEEKNSMKHSNIGIVIDECMLKHKNQSSHPERPGRISKPLELLSNSNVLYKLVPVGSRKVTREELLTVHREEYLNDIENTCLMGSDDLYQLQNTYNSIYICNDTYESALISCGSTLQIVNQVVLEKLQGGLALVRPPGHHAEAHTACGFCFYNNVAVAAKHAQYVSSNNSYKVLIFDWDVHHGNGTQNMFYDDPSVMYISLHRYDGGFFFPSSTDANYDMVGSSAGKGFNVNVAWEGGVMGDKEYLLAFKHLVMPLTEKFQPDLIIISAGFDAAKGDPLGGYKVTPPVYAYMTNCLKLVAKAGVVIALEGGYNLKVLSKCILQCTEALLDYKVNIKGEEVSKHSIIPESKEYPSEASVSCLLNTLNSLLPYWSILKEQIEEVLKLQNIITDKKLENDLNSLSLNDSNGVITRSQHIHTRSRTRSGKKHQKNVKTPSEIKQQDGLLITYQSNTKENPNDTDMKNNPSSSTSAADIEKSVFKNLETKINNVSETQELDMLQFKDTNIENKLQEIDSRKEELQKTAEYISTSSGLNKNETNNTENILSKLGTDNNITKVPQQQQHNKLQEIGGIKEESTLQTLKNTQTSPGPNNNEDSTAIEIRGATGSQNENTDLDFVEMVLMAQENLSGDCSGYVMPLDYCPHLSNSELNTELNIEIDHPCLICVNVTSENWVCLFCQEVYCGRYINRHMVAHFKETGHCVALSLADLSFWCFSCDAYLNNFKIETLKHIYNKAHILKHGCPPNHS